LWGFSDDCSVLKKGCENVDWIQLAHDMDHWQGFLRKQMLIIFEDKVLRGTM
jgi:hypothetical protein